jgi:beta-glucanase (GH16 family)
MLRLVLFVALLSPLLLRADPTLQNQAATPIDTSPSPTPVVPAPNANTTLTFDDEFGPVPAGEEGKRIVELDTTKWNRWYPWPVVINHELQAYVPDAFAFLPDGGLRIVADKRTFMEQKYTSGSITTFGKFTQAYGYFEMKAKLPKGQGFWPAFWIMPPELNKTGGAEIDVMEALDQDPYTVHTTLHSTDPHTGQPAGMGHETKTPDLTADYHTYAVSWRPKDLVWLFDGKEVFRIAGDLVPSVPEYMLVNLAIGGAWPKPPNAATPFPSYMDLKYVRVYQFKDLPPVDPPPLALNGTTVTSDPARPGETIEIATSLTAGKTDVPPLLVRLYVTDFPGKKFLTEQDTNLPATPAGATVPVAGKWAVPRDLPPGVYTIAIKIECPSDPKLGGYVGCLCRFTVSPAAN